MVLAGRRVWRWPGQALVDLAFVVLLFLTLVVLIFEGGWLTANWLALGNAARAGARAGSVATATDADILDAVNRTAAIFTGSYPTAAANTPQSGCAAEHTVCVCRYGPGPTACVVTVSRGDRVDVTVRHRFAFLPFAGGFIGQNAGIQLTAYEQAPIQ